MNKKKMREFAGINEKKQVSEAVDPMGMFVMIASTAAALGLAGTFLYADYQRTLEDYERGKADIEKIKQRAAKLMDETKKKMQRVSD